MLLIQTTIGELYKSLSTEELKEFELYLRKMTTGKNNTLIQLHILLRDISLSGQLTKLDYNYIKAELFATSGDSTSKLTTYTNLLINHIKEFLILSKTREKNIYTETLWGELLIERRLKRNLLLKTSQFKINIFKDQYPIHKIYYNSREIKFLAFFNSAKKKFGNIFHSIKIEFQNLEDVYLISKLELFVAYISNYNLVNDIDEFYNFIINDDSYKKGISSSNPFVKLNALLLNLIIRKDYASYSELKDKFILIFDDMSYELRVQVFPVLMNFGLDKIIEGENNYAFENYNLLKFMNSKNLLFTREYFTLTRFNLYIGYELNFGSIEVAKEMLDSHIDLVQSNQRDSFYSLNNSKIEFSKKNYKDSLRNVSSINPSDSLFFYPQYKIMLIKCHIMLEDIDRVMAERENFYKYIYNTKNIPEDVQRRHKVFIKYAEYMTESRFEYLTGYMRKRIEAALLQTSPYFTEKEWMRERWNELKAKFDEKEEEE